MLGSDKAGNAKTRKLFVSMWSNAKSKPPPNSAPVLGHNSGATDASKHGYYRIRKGTSSSEHSTHSLMGTTARK